MQWWDIYRTFSDAFQDVPTSKASTLSNIPSAGRTDPDALPLRQDFNGTSKNVVPVKNSNEMIDLSSSAGRANRYMEYERLRIIPEIEAGLNIYADEACMVGSTKIMTPLGDFTLEELRNKKHPDEMFLVYCYDHKKQDFSLGWAHHPRLVKMAETVEVLFSDGQVEIMTPDHLVLLRNAEWKPAGDLKPGDEVMPFSKINPVREYNNLQFRQYPRIYSLTGAWKTERYFVDEWKHRNKTIRHLSHSNAIIKEICEGGKIKPMAVKHNVYHKDIYHAVKLQGFTYRELRWLFKNYSTQRFVKVVAKGKIRPVYDLTVNEHHNFATPTGIYHNCQYNDDGHVFEISGSNSEAVKECNKLTHDWLELDHHLWNYMKGACLLGDEMIEVMIDPSCPQDGVMKLKSLPAGTMHRIESVMGRLYEFQQSFNGAGPNLSVINTPISDTNQSGDVIRFTPEQIVHLRLGEQRRSFLPYGQSIIEPAKTAAYQLRLMEDAMVVYRLTRSSERRVFYIDCMELPDAKANALMERTKDQFKKKKIFSPRAASGINATGVDEKWNPITFDEDIWVPIRRDSATRIDTLPGGAQLGEIDDALYFRNKLLIALGIPRAYLSQEDINVSRMNLSSQDLRFAKTIERLQGMLAQGIKKICFTHLELRGFPYSSYGDLKIKLTPPSDYRDANRNEIVQARFDRAVQAVQAGIYSTYDALTDIIKIQPDKAKEMISRAKLEKIDNGKLEAMLANPEFLGIVNPAQESGQEIGTEAGGPSTELTPTGEDGMPTDAGGALPEGGEEGQQPSQAQSTLPEPTPEEIDKYNFGINNASAEQDEEDVDLGELED